MARDRQCATAPAGTYFGMNLDWGSGSIASVAERIGRTGTSVGCPGSAGAANVTVRPAQASARR
jgi:hypothetical protein